MNIAPVAPEVYEEVGPYIELAENLGKMVAQIARGGVESIDIEFVGGTGRVDTRILQARLCSRACSPSSSAESVNFVNADYYAEQRGIHVTEVKRAETRDYVSLITVRAQTPQGPMEVGATLVGKKNEPRLVSSTSTTSTWCRRQYMAFFIYEDVPA